MSTRVASETSRTWRFPRLIIGDHLALLVIVWACYFATIVLVMIGINRFGDLPGSVWDPASGAAVWYIAFIAGYIFHTILPIHVAHGRIRRDFLIESTMFTGTFALGTAALVTAGYWLELGVYRIAGWDASTTKDHLFSSHRDIVPMFFESLALNLVWIAVGMFVGACIYRDPSAGWVSLMPATVFVGLIGSVTTESWGSFGRVLERVLNNDAGSMPMAIGVAAICVLLLYAMLWAVVKDTPIRKK